MSYKAARCKRARPRGGGTLHTRSAEVARVLGTSAPYQLQGLQDEDCWLLFCHFSLGANIHTYNFQDLPRYFLNPNCKFIS